jgi:hypothetical protein
MIIVSVSSTAAAPLSPDRATVSLNLTDDLFLRSSNWARWQLGLPLPVD